MSASRIKRETPLEAYIRHGRLDRMARDYVVEGLRHQTRGELREAATAFSNASTAMSSLYAAQSDLLAAIAHASAEESARFQAFLDATFERLGVDWDWQRGLPVSS